MSLRAVVFDFDGVLVDSEPLHYRAMREALLAEAIEIDTDEYASHYLAYDDRVAIRLALERHGFAYDALRLERVVREKAARFQSLARAAPLFPGVRELVRSLAALLPLAVASGALRAEIEMILEAVGLRAHFAAIVAADDVARGKPHPEPYLTAVAHLRVFAPALAAHECVAFEDSGTGIASARAAGMKVVGVANSFPAARLHGAHRVVESLAGLGTEQLAALFAD